MSIKSILAGVVVLVMMLASPVRSEVSVHVSLQSQSMTVWVHGIRAYTWKVSTGKPGHETPPGMFRPTWLNRDHYSSLYDWTPMPYAVFFNGNIAIHGTTALRQLGRRASHGCIRLSNEDAAALFALVEHYGKKKTLIIVD